MELTTTRYSVKQQSRRDVFAVPYDKLTDQRQNPQMDAGSVDGIGGDAPVFLLNSDRCFITIIKLLYPLLRSRNQDLVTCPQPVHITRTWSVYDSHIQIIYSAWSTLHHYITHRERGSLIFERSNQQPEERCQNIKYYIEKRLP